MGIKFEPVKKYYFVDKREVSKKEFGMMWLKEDFFYIVEGKRYSIPPPESFGIWVGQHEYMISTGFRE